MPEITDDHMRAMLTQTKSYTVVLLKATAKRREPGADAIVWEHGRRNFELRERGVLAIVCPVVDDSGWSGVGIFDAPPEETAKIMDDDPGVKAGIFTYEVHPVRGFPGSSLPA
ncbi:hypothetical protein [Microbispora sp. NPDC049125]|uniref:hypothetical protein n=1 Tax=Microbispora sp. NPDC049125 TaxID=3154929 RepID=UPI0034659277